MPYIFFLYLKYKKGTDWWIFLGILLEITQLMKIVMWKTRLNTVVAV